MPLSSMHYHIVLNANRVLVRILLLQESTPLYQHVFNALVPVTINGISSQVL